MAAEGKVSAIGRLFAKMIGAIVWLGRNKAHAARPTEIDATRGGRALAAVSPRNAINGTLCRGSVRLERREIDDTKRISEL